jgi:hypothetical protein
MLDADLCKGSLFIWNELALAGTQKLVFYIISFKYFTSLCTFRFLSLLL